MSEAVPEVSAPDSAGFLASGAILLDVREQDEWDAGHAPDAVHLPMSELAGRAAEIPRDVAVLCVCHVGGRSTRWPPR